MPPLWANLSAAVGRAVWPRHGSAQGMIASLFSAAFAASLVTCFAPEQDYGLPWPTASRPTIPCGRNADDL